MASEFSSDKIPTGEIPKKLHLRPFFVVIIYLHYFSIFPVRILPVEQIAVRIQNGIFLKKAAGLDYFYVFLFHFFRWWETYVFNLQSVILQQIFFEKTCFRTARKRPKITMQNLQSFLSEKR